MSLQISYLSDPRIRGFRRYYVGFAGGPHREFLIESPPRPQSRDWKIMFARALGIAITQLEVDLRDHRS